MLSSTDITRLYFKKNLIPLLSGALFISVICLIVCFAVLNGSNALIFVLISVLLIALSIAVPFVMAKNMEKKGNQSAEIFRAEGFTLNFCDSYRQAYIDNVKKPFAPHLILCASYYDKIGDHNSAEFYIEQVNNKKLDPESKFVYCLQKLLLCGKTGDWSEGEDFRNDNIKFIQNYMEKKKAPEYKVQMYIALALVDCATKKYADAFGLLNFGYKPKGKNDVNFLNILITAIYIYSKMKDQTNLETAVHNAQLFLSKFTAFEYPWCKDYYEKLIIRASQGKL